MKVTKFAVIIENDLKRKNRILILATMAILTICCGLLMPKININTDMTRYLPSDSRMGKGLDSLKANFPGIDTNAPTVKAMFCNLQDKDSTAKVLSGEDGILMITGVRDRDSLTLFEMTAESGADLDAIAERIRTGYGDCLVVETNANSIMPDNMGFILIVGTGMIFLILFLMCSSFVEALLFILTIALSVVLNMGTNALLPSVSMMTNTIVAVLQFVLSIDYSIILMNRFRMEREHYDSSEKAMSAALRKSSSSILSSSLTTIVGLLALVFMKFKIGTDLGVVLAKGVFFSLLSIYTILPALILIFEKAIDKTTKKVPLIPTDKVAVFEVKYKWALSCVFLLILVSSAILQKRTELSYASIWESEIAKAFPTRTSYMLLYPTEREDEVIGLVDSLAADPRIVTAVSYPSILKKKMKSEEMVSNINRLIDMMPAGDSLPIDRSLLTKENLQVIYYGIAHPVRDERMSFNDMLTLADEAKALGMIPEDLDPDELISKFTLGGTSDEQSSGPSVATVQDSSAAVLPETLPAADSAMLSAVDSAAFPAMLPAVDSAYLGVAASDSASAGPKAVPSRFSYENSTRQMSVQELSGFMNMGEKDSRIIYRMAGRQGSTMSPSEFIGFVNKKIIPNTILRKAISEEQIKGLESVSHQIDSVLLAGPSGIAGDAADSTGLRALNDPADSTFLSAGTSASTRNGAAGTDAGKKAGTEAKAAPTPLERLAEMYISGKRYSASTIYKSLRDAGIDIDRQMTELMFMYYGSKKGYDPETAVSIEDILGFLGMGNAVEESLGALRGDRWSMAAIVTDYPVESGETFAFVEEFISNADKALGEDNFLIGEPVMYKEMRDGFRKELLFLTILTVLAIFVIVAISFRSVVIPTILVGAVLSGVFINVFVSGLGGHTMLYLAYLIVQSILMGATIDYGILFSNFYIDSRRSGAKKTMAVKAAYKASIHTIMTSGSIMVCAPYVMSLLLTDPTISSILSALSTGALAAILMILFLLPATLTACDRLIVGKRVEQPEN